jgi:ABC-2 type transport system permease protein
MRLMLLHARAQAVSTWRTPAYWLPALAFPVVFFLLFGLASASRLARQGLGSEVAITPFLLFTTLNVTLASLSMQVAADRENPWERRLRLLPVSPLTRFGGRLVFVLGFNVVSWIPLLLLATLTTDLRLDAGKWPIWLASVVIGAIPFGLLGIAIGYRFPAQAAMTISNILFLMLSFAGGLFVPAAALPAAVQSAMPYVPSQEYLQFVLVAIHNTSTLIGPSWGWLLLFGWTALFGLLAIVAVRRDEGVRYG